MTQSLDAGLFLEWLESTRQMLRGRGHADVPCGECVGCCVSSYPIPLRTTDTVALERVPAVHLHFSRQPGSLARMGFREDGTCPMLRDNQCTIYQDRPQTCRDYDCRIYAATGLLPDGDRPVIRDRVLAWRFRFETPAAAQTLDRLQRMAGFIRNHAEQFPSGMRADSATGAALMALKCVALGGTEVPLEAKAIMETVRGFFTEP